MLNCIFRPGREQPLRKEPAGRSARRCVFLLCLGCLVFACEPRFDKDLLEKLVKMDKPVYKGKPVSSEALATVRLILDEYHRLQEQGQRSETGRQDEQAGIRIKELGMLYYRLGVDYLEIDLLQQQQPAPVPAGEVRTTTELAREFRSGRELLIYQSALVIRLLAQGMYRDALASLESVLDVFPENERLHYYAGLCAANLGKACVTDEQAAQREDWYRQAYLYYKQAHILEPRYPEALLALSILLIYEMDRPEEAENWLVKLLQLETRNPKAYFLLGALYYRQERLEEALEQYKTAEEVATDAETRGQAGENIARIMKELYGK